ncbi:MAG: hypothetical protein E7233_07925 [Lachnospiraceae bacterium]|nr:hypothetical protein [Lachnospiraceae bacterium]
MASHKKMDLLGISAFCESLGMMIKAGIPVTEAVNLLGRHEGSTGPLGQTLDEMEHAIDEGSTLAGAMKGAGIFPEYAVKMVEAGETTGRLEDILFRLASYYREQHAINRKLRSVIIYPTAMIIMIIIVLLIMLFAVLPRFSEVYNTLTGSISSGSYAYINAAYVFCWVVLVLMVLLVAAVVIGAVMWKGKGRETVEKILAKNSTCAALMENLALYRFTSAYEVFLASGAMQDQAVLDALPMTGYKPVEDKIRQVIRRMEEGVGFAQAANDVELYEPIYGRMLIPGERSGNSDEVLRRLTELLASDCNNRTEKLVGTIEPLLSGILMITIAIALLSVMLPLIGIMNSIG